MCWRRTFPGDERQLSVLRQWLASLLPEGPARDDLASVATELGANALRHTSSGRGGWFAVQISWHGQLVRIAVEDCGGPGEPRVIDDPAAEHGRGLLVVHGLSLRTGVCGDHRGRVVWADISWAAAGDGRAEPGPAAEPPEDARDLPTDPADEAGPGRLFAMLPTVLPAANGHRVPP
jgi:hypothetical protein